MNYRFIQGWGHTTGVWAKESPLGLARGYGQSYGDSALNSVVRSPEINSTFVLDEVTGILTARSGASLGDILRKIIPLGWILPVIPGSSRVSIGGAIASDVHGKNHVSQGSFSEHVESLKLEIAGVIHTVLPREPLFRATCGGMGLTGTILEAAVRLKKLKRRGWSKKDTACGSLKELISKLEESQADFVNAWVDSSQLNRGVLTELHEANLSAASFLLPSAPLPWTCDVWNDLSLNLFNAAYFHFKKYVTASPVNLARELFPLEQRVGWNRLCGEQGIVQLHFVVPNALDLLAIFGRLSRNPLRPLLISLKKMGRANEQFLSFPMAGVAAALDFKNTPEARTLICELTDAILEFRGKVYLTKDSLLTESQFKKMYPDWSDFQRIRKEWGSAGLYTSQQSRRLGLD